MGGSAPLSLLIFSALVVPFPVLGGLCWWFWKHRHDD